MDTGHYIFYLAYYLDKSFDHKTVECACSL